jgi:hypothetical protein
MANRTIQLIAGFAIAAASMQGAAQTDACGLLPSEAIRQATGEAVASSKATSAAAGKLRQSQCFYTLPTFTNSISVTLTTGAARDLWERQFHGDGDAAEEKEAGAKAEPVTGIGDEAYWVHSFVGNLYVRKGNRFFRISLGGKLTDDERRTRAKALAAAALRQLR